VPTFPVLESFPSGVAFDPVPGARVENEKELVQRILAGDREAQEALYRELAPRMYPVCVHFLGHEDPDAEDIVQDTFLTAFRKLSTFEFRSSLYTWLNHICVNLCYERLRRKKRTLQTLSEDLERLTAGVSEARESERAREEEKRARLALLERVATSMSERCRQVLDRRDKKGESYIDIARSLKMPIGTVMSQLARCRKALRILMENELKTRTGHLQ
jgi:RNA polymerase sigma-70 factor (ECF subfamily)